MKNVIKAILLLLLAAGVASAQAAPEFRSSGQVLNDWISNAETHMVGVAEAMPEDKYSFAPKEGEFHEVRTFAEQVRHVAALNYFAAAKMLGEEPAAHTEDETGPANITTKAEILEYLKGSFKQLHRAAASINATNLTSALPNTKGTWQRTRIGLAVDAVAHTFDHYGQVVEYLRMNGIVPPASR